MPERTRSVSCCHGEVKGETVGHACVHQQEQPTSRYSSRPSSWGEGALGFIMAICSTCRLLLVGGGTGCACIYVSVCVIEGGLKRDGVGMWVGVRVSVRDRGEESTCCDVPV